MSFNQFNKEMKAHTQLMCSLHPILFVTAVPPDGLWAMYLKSFPEGTNPMFRARTEHDCTCCRHFIRHFGAIVGINPISFELETIWGFTPSHPAYQVVAHKLDEFVKSFPVVDRFVSDVRNLGTKETHAKKDDKIETWNHMHIELLPAQVTNLRGTTLDTVKGGFRTNVSTLQRALEEITPESVKEVLELIKQGSLYRGESWTGPLTELQKTQREYAAVQHKHNFCWYKSASLASVNGIRNSSIGTLLLDLSAGLEMDDAVRKYEAVTAPSSYQRPKAIITKATLESATKKIQELGVLESMPHRFAHLDDINVGNVLFADRNVRAKMKGTVLDDLAGSLPSDPKKFNRVEEVAIDKFISDILPGSSSVDVLFESRLNGNLVSLLAPCAPEAPPIFKWSNGFAWAYKGNLADSMKERVKAHGGKVDGVLRFSIQWNEEDDNPNDMDAHCVQPAGHNKIYFRAKTGHSSGGNLDVDITSPDGVAVENITWPSLSKMPNGVYIFGVHVWAHRGGKNGFRAEIEFDGQVHSFDYRDALRQDLFIEVAKVTKTSTGFSIKPTLKSSSTPGAPVWNVPTNTFVPVHAIMYSPNYWDGQQGVGNRHVMFMLKNCVSDETPNGFFNEYLRAELIPHRRVFEVLGGKMAVAPDSNQLSGVGFSTTQRNSVTVKVRGQTERVMKVMF